LSDARRRILFLGGNGHSTERLEPARAVLRQRGEPWLLRDVAYPGFEDRPRAASLEAFLTAVSAELTSAVVAGQTLLYGTGIGGLIALALRARGEHLDTPLLLQGAVLWGVKTRLFPRLMRLGMGGMLPRLFGFGPFQDWFVRRKFRRPLTPEVRQAFFSGYARCPAMADFFKWLTPAFLKELEQRFSTHREGLEHITAWWGEHDHVVPLAELEQAEKALQVDWPLRRFPEWGHYPMLDDPEDWVRALTDVVAEPGSLQR
jgi:pimeloyl-ACP methyl ester carboxylesterase